MSNLSDNIFQIASFTDYSLNKAFISATVLCDIYCMGILPVLLISVKKNLQLHYKNWDYIISLTNL